MKTKTKRWASLLCIAALLAALLPVGGTSYAVSTAQMLGTETETAGDWVGVYGSDGYVLPYYSTTLTSGRDNPVAADVYALPDYVDSYTKYRTAYWTFAPGDPRALQTPDGTARKKLTVYSGTDFTMTFNLNDSDPHLFTVYTTDFGSAETVSQRFEILDMSNQVLDSRVVDTINDGKYITYQVSGSFKLKATKLSGTSAYAEGFFFDEIVPSTATGLTATAEPGREAELSWSDASGGPSVVLRKAGSETEYTELAQVGSGVTTYTDTDLQPGESYAYAIQNLSGMKRSVPSAAALVTIPSYTETVLAFGDPAYAAAEPGIAVELEVTLTDDASAPIAGQPITFTLQGDGAGTYIDAALGSAVTDAAGEATLTYTPPYAGEFTVLASMPPDDVEELNGAEAEVELQVSNPAWDAPPLILRTSEAVQPGALVSLNGEAMIADDWDDVEVKVAPYTGTLSATPGIGATTLDIEQKDELDGRFLTARLPAAADPGIYQLWVSNAEGWSEPVLLNAPRPLFISEYEVYEGLSIDLSGRNLMAQEYGAEGETLLRLQGASTAYEVELTARTPYSLRFVVSGVPQGEYEVEVSADDGDTWHALDSGQTLTVTAPGDDPLGLGVAWADHFEWDQVYDVTDYGAVADDSLDDTEAIEDAIAAAKTAGGGVVYLPEGAYHATRIGVPADIVLMGDGREETLLVHTGGSANFIYSTGDGKTVGRSGIARLGLRASDPDLYPDAFVWFGHDWGAAVNERDLRTASEFFAIETGVEYPVLDPIDTSGGSGRAQGMLVVADQRLVIKDNVNIGWAAQHNRVYMNAYAAVTDNYMEYSFSQMPVAAAYTFIRDNEIVIRAEADVEVHGIGAKALSHVENNIVRYTSPELKTTYHNDGESIFFEMPAGYFATGEILGATADTVTLMPVQPIGTVQARFGGIYVAITGGKGLGQLREVTLDSGTTYALLDEWDIIPDRTSTFSLLTPNDRITVYRNTIEGGQRGIWLYGNAYDGVVADNHLANTDGIYIYSSLVKGSNRSTPSYFNTIVGNWLSGTPLAPGGVHATGIIAASQRNGTGGAFYSTGIYGLDVRDNFLAGTQTPVAGSSPYHQKYSGLVSSAATLSSDSPKVFTPEDRDNANVVYQTNRLDTLNIGLHLMDGLYGHIEAGNQYIDVLDEIYEHYGAGTSGLLELPDSYADRRPPAWPAQSRLSAADAGSGKAELSWPEARDNVAVTGYRIYQGGALMDTVGPAVLDYEATGLSPGTHAFVVTAVDAAGGESYEGLMVAYTE
ncbi:glycosyl hydrolase family 28-related protein [Paenibacillus sabuli]|nr:glycosyl hydrolase family 28-related protein [Paenibacillus sabuli]